VSPRSTVIQMSPVHTGRTGDPAACLDHLLETMVKRPRVKARGAAHDAHGSELNAPVEDNK
jgi:hypothetical protein